MKTAAAEEQVAAPPAAPEGNGPVAPPSPSPPAAAAAVAEDAEFRAKNAVRALLREAEDAGDGRCWVDMITQYECSIQYTGTSAVSVCYPVQRFFKRCVGKANVEITSLIHTPQDRYEHRRRNAADVGTPPLLDERACSSGQLTASLALCVVAWPLAHQLP